MKGHIMKNKIVASVAEQELHINYSPAEMGKYCEIYTTIPYAIVYLKKMAQKFPAEYQIIHTDQYSCTARVLYKLVKPRAPKQMSEQQRQAMAERLAAARLKKKEDTNELRDSL